MSPKKWSVQDWLVGIFGAVIVATAGAVAAQMVSHQAVDELRIRIEAHETLDAHSVSSVRQQNHERESDRRLQRIEAKLDQLIDMQMQRKGDP